MRLLPAEVTYSSVWTGRERDGSLRGPALSLARKASQRSARARLIRERVAPYKRPFAPLAAGSVVAGGRCVRKSFIGPKPGHSLELPINR